MAQKKVTAKRTQRLIDFINSDKVHINWSDSISESNGWKIIHGTIGRQNLLILDMGKNGYQTYLIDNGPPEGESVQEEIERLYKPITTRDNNSRQDD